jgi:hypothetical protein
LEVEEMKETLDMARRVHEADGCSGGWRRQWGAKQLEETRRAIVRRRRLARRRRMDKYVVCLYKRGTQQRDLGIIEVGVQPSSPVQECVCV